MTMRVLFGVLALSIALGAHLYVYRRLIHAVTEKRLTRLLAGLTIGVLSLGGIAARVWFRGETGAWPLAIAFPVWLGFLLYMLLALVTLDVAKAAWRLRGKPHSPERRQFLARAAAVTAAGAG